MNQAEKIVQKQLDYYNNHDLKGFMSTYHEDIEILSLVDDSLILKGIEALEVKYRERFEIQKVHAELVNRMVIGNQVIDHEHVRGIKPDEIAKAIAIYHVEDELIKKVWFLFEE